MDFVKKKDFLICIDSDGCVMDTMDIKHFECFGPRMIEVWDLYENREELLKRWNVINLYSMTRGINRFKGLYLILKEIHESGKEVDGIEVYEDWVETTRELSNQSLERAIEEREGDTICLKNALKWSELVNKSIENLPDESKLPYEKALEGLRAAHKYADVVIVSSANRQAVEEEWAMHHLLEEVDAVMAQDAGTKAACIKKLLEYGYSLDHVLMVGDAPGDLDAASKNGVFYYPILVNKETMSWERFCNEAVTHFVKGTYAGTYQKQMLDAFVGNLQ